MLSLQLFLFSFLYLAPVCFHFPTQWYLCRSCRSLHKYVWAVVQLKKRVMFSDDKNWFPISSTMTASFPATQAIWPTLLRRSRAVDQGDSCLHLRPCSLRSESLFTDASSIRNWSSPLENSRIEPFHGHTQMRICVCRVYVQYRVFMCLGEDILF